MTKTHYALFTFSAIPHYKAPLFLLVLLGTSLAGCRKCANGDTSDPLTFALLSKQGKNLLTSQNTFRVYYRGENNQIGELQLNTASSHAVSARDSTAAIPYKYMFSQPATVGDSQGQHEWYLEAGGKTDTLQYTAQQIHPDACSYQSKVLSVMFNGKPAIKQQFADGTTYYVLQRAH